MTPLVIQKQENEEMNELIVKCVSGFSSLCVISYTIKVINDKGNGAGVKTPIGELNLGRQIEFGTLKLTNEIRDFKSDIDTRMDNMSSQLVKSNVKISKELGYLRGLTTYTHIDIAY